MKQEINLYRPELRPRRTLFPARQMALLVALLILGLAGLNAVSWYELDRARKRAANAERGVVAAEARVEEMRRRFPVKKLDPALKKRLSNRRDALAKNQDVVEKLASGYFGSVEGLSAHLEGFARQHVDGTWLTAVRIAAGGKGVALEGRALVPELIPEYLDRLSQEPALETQVFSELSLQIADDGLANEVEFDVRTEGLAKRDDS